MLFGFRVWLETYKSIEPLWVRRHFNAINDNSNVLNECLSSSIRNEAYASADSRRSFSSHNCFLIMNAYKVSMESGFLRRQTYKEEAFCGIENESKYFLNIVAVVRFKFLTVPIIVWLLNNEWINRKCRQKRRTKDAFYPPHLFEPLRRRSLLEKHQILECLLVFKLRRERLWMKLY